MSRQPLAVWTDFGGVLTPPVAETLNRYCTQVGLTPEQFRGAMAAVAADFGTEDAMAPLDTPLTDQADWERRMERALATGYGLRRDLSGFPDLWFADRAVNGPWLDRLRELRDQGVFVGLLSNMPPGWHEQWQTLVPAGFFDGVLLSFQAGLRKPQPEFFARAAQAAAAVLGVPAEQLDCVLVDDLVANCAGARACGWQAVEFTDADSAWRQLAPRVATAGRAAVR